MRRAGEREMRREREGLMGRWGEWENFYFSVLPSSFFLLPTDIGLTSVTCVTSAARESVAELPSD